MAAWRYLWGCIHGDNRTTFGRIGSRARLCVAPDASGMARSTTNRRCDVGRMGRVGRLGLITAVNSRLERPQGHRVIWDKNRQQSCSGHSGFSPAVAPDAPRRSCWQVEAPLGAGRSRSDPFSVNESNRVADHACICCRRVNHRALLTVPKLSRDPCHRPEPVPRAASTRHYREHGPVTRSNRVFGRNVAFLQPNWPRNAPYLKALQQLEPIDWPAQGAVRKSGHGRRSNRRALRRPPLT
jgi:hypothetical protein